VAKRVQEWLTLHGYSLVIDGEPGPASRAALIKFGSNKCGNVGGVLDRGTWSLLVAPLWRAFLLPPATSGGTGVTRAVRDMVKILAAQHLAQMPREVGGDNRGPWVRSYCRGNDGPAWRWCAGFASTILELALEAIGSGNQVSAIRDQLRYTVSCDELLEFARTAGRLTADPKQVSPGDLFILVKDSGEAYHTGIVTQMGDEHITTIEGNSNDEGSANGYEVCSRYRDFNGKRFVRLF
jgi:hypothetical protein